jgi:hypothetical protein
MLRKAVDTVTAMTVTRASTATAATIQNAGDLRRVGPGGVGGGRRGSSVVSADH